MRYLARSTLHLSFFLHFRNVGKSEIFISNKNFIGKIRKNPEKFCEGNRKKLGSNSSCQNDINNCIDFKHCKLF